MNIHEFRRRLRALEPEGLPGKLHQRLGLLSGIVGGGYLRSVVGAAEVREWEKYVRSHENSVLSEKIEGDKSPSFWVDLEKCLLHTRVKMGLPFLYLSMLLGASLLEMGLISQEKKGTVLAEVLYWIYTDFLQYYFSSWSDRFGGLFNMYLENSRTDDKTVVSSYSDLGQTPPSAERQLGTVSRLQGVSFHTRVNFPSVALFLASNPALKTVYRQLEAKYALPSRYRSPQSISVPTEHLLKLLVIVKKTLMSKEPLDGQVYWVLFPANKPRAVLKKIWQSEPGLLAQSWLNEIRKPMVQFIEMKWKEPEVKNVLSFYSLFTNQTQASETDVRDDFIKQLKKHDVFSLFPCLVAAEQADIHGVSPLDTQTMIVLGLSLYSLWVTCNIRFPKERSLYGYREVSDWNNQRERIMSLGGPVAFPHSSGVASVAKFLADSSVRHSQSVLGEAVDRYPLEELDRRFLQHSSQRFQRILESWLPEGLPTQFHGSLPGPVAKQVSLAESHDWLEEFIQQHLAIFNLPAVPHNDKKASEIRRVLLEQPVVGQIPFIYLLMTLSFEAMEKLAQSWAVPNTVLAHALGWVLLDASVKKHSKASFCRLKAFAETMWLHEAPEINTASEPSLYKEQSPPPRPETLNPILVCYPDFRRLYLTPIARDQARTCFQSPVRVRNVLAGLGAWIFFEEGYYRSPDMGHEERGDVLNRLKMKANSEIGEISRIMAHYGPMGFKFSSDRSFNIAVLQFYNVLTRQNPTVSFEQGLEPFLKAMEKPEDLKTFLPCCLAVYCAQFYGNQPLHTAELKQLGKMVYWLDWLDNGPKTRLSPATYRGYTFTTDGSSRSAQITRQLVEWNAERRERARIPIGEEVPLASLTHFITQQPSLTSQLEAKPATSKSAKTRRIKAPLKSEQKEALPSPIPASHYREASGPSSIDPMPWLLAQLQAKPLSRQASAHVSSVGRALLKSTLSQSDSPREMDGDLFGSKAETPKKSRQLTKRSAPAVFPSIGRSNPFSAPSPAVLDNAVEMTLMTSKVERLADIKKSIREFSQEEKNATAPSPPSEAGVFAHRRNRSERVSTNRVEEGLTMKKK